MTKQFLVPLLLPADPANPLEAATKQYVDVTAGAGAGTVQSFTFSSTTTEAGGFGNQVRFNHATQSLATKVWISQTTFDGLDVAVGLSRISTGWQIYIQDFDDSTAWILFNVSANGTDKGTYWEFIVTYNSGPGVPTQKIALQTVTPPAAGKQPLHAALTDLTVKYTPATTTVQSSLKFTESTNGGTNTITLQPIGVAWASDFIVTIPAANGQLTTIAGIQTFTNKTIALGSNTVSGTLAEFNAALTDADFASLTRIPGLVVITGAQAALTDLLEVVDVSDTTMAATGTNKRMTLAELIAFLNANGIGGGGGAVAAVDVSYDDTGNFGGVVGANVQAALEYVDFNIMMALSGSLGQTSATGEMDWDTLSALGIVSITPSVAPATYHAPPDSATLPGVLHVFSPGDGSVTQTWVYDGGMWSRWYDTTVWSPWVKAGGGGGGGSTAVEIIYDPTGNALLLGTTVQAALDQAEGEIQLLNSEKADNGLQIIVTDPLNGGGYLTDDITIGVNEFGSTNPGVVPASGGGTANYLRADGTWTLPSGGGSTMLTGSGVPGAGVGANGDFYIDTAGDDIYGPKAGSGYGAEESIAIASAPTTDAAGYTFGVRVHFPNAGRITKIRYQRTAASAATLTLKVWSDAQVMLTSVTDTQSGAGEFTVALPTPWTVTAGDIRTFTVSATGNVPFHTSSTGTPGSTANVVFQDMRYANGAASWPSSVIGTQTYFVEPIFEPVVNVWSLALETTTGGSTILDGTGPPDVALGAVGNYYEDTTNGILYGPKSASGWGAQQRPTIGGTPPTSNTSQQEGGVRYRFTAAGRVVGCRYWRNTTVGATFTVKAWKDSTTTKIAEVADTQAVVNGAFTVTFPTPVLVAANETWTFTLANATAIPRNETAQTVTNTANVIFIENRSASTINQYPSTLPSTAYYYVEPIFEPNEAWPVTVRTVASAQPLDPELLAIAGLTSAADRLPYFTGAGTASLATFTNQARNLLDDDDATANRATIGLGNVDNTSDANKPVSTAQAAADALKADKTTTIATTAPLTGGGDLGANRTIDISTFTATVKGAVPPPTTVTGKYLKDDGTWAAPGGGAGTGEIFLGAGTPTAVTPTEPVLWVDLDEPGAVGGGGTVSDATASVKGVLQLAGDLAGTSAAPTVPGLASKADVGHSHAGGPGADATTTTKGIIQLAGDLSGTAALPRVAALTRLNAITDGEMALVEFSGANDSDRFRAACTQVASMDPKPVVVIPADATLDAGTTPFSLPGGFAMRGTSTGVETEFGYLAPVNIRHTGQTGSVGVFKMAAGSKGQTLRGICFQGTSSVRAFQDSPFDATGDYWKYVTFDNVSFNGFDSIYQGPWLGCRWYGQCYLNNFSCNRSPLYISGSDNGLWTDGGFMECGNIGTYSNAAQLAAMIRCGNLTKTDFGPIYVTGSPTTPFRLDGGEGGVSISQMTIEGRPVPGGGPRYLWCAGELVRLTAGSATIRGKWWGFAMRDPAATGRSPGGFVVVTGGDHVIDGGTFQPFTAGNYPGGVVPPFVYVTGGHIRISNITLGPNAGGVKPVVKYTTASMVDVDSSVNASAI